MKSSREQFEEWYTENWGHTEDDHETMFERDPDSPEDYYRLGVRLAHHSWQASRAEIEIELPKYHELTTQDTISARAEKSTYNFGIYDSADAIRAAGLTVKGDA